jgi:hypothetical protein
MDVLALANNGWHLTEVTHASAGLLDWIIVLGSGWLYWQSVRE